MDLYSASYKTPVDDKTNNYKLISYAEAKGVQTYKFSRPLVSKDTAKDDDFVRVSFHLIPKGH